MVAVLGPDYYGPPLIDSFIHSGVKGRPGRKADNLTDVCVPIV
jgi:hypothetical protein